MSTILTAFENIMYLHEEASATKRYKLTRDEYLVLCGYSAGHDIIELKEYFDKHKDYIYKIRQQTIKKFSAKHFYEVMYLFGQLSCKND